MNLVEEMLKSIKGTAREKRVISQAIKAAADLAGTEYKAKKVEVADPDARTRTVTITFRN